MGEFKYSYRDGWYWSNNDEDKYEYTTQNIFDHFVAPNQKFVSSSLPIIHFSPYDSAYHICSLACDIGQLTENYLRLNGINIYSFGRRKSKEISQIMNNFIKELFMFVHKEKSNGKN